MVISSLLTAARRAAPLSRVLREDTASAPPRRVIQLVSSLNCGDAVGNEVSAIDELLRRNYCRTELWCAHAQPGTLPVRIVSRLPPLSGDDLLIYHFASLCPFAPQVAEAKCRVLLRYHNVTPSAFFRGYDPAAERATAGALRQLPALLKRADGALPASEFSAADLRRSGYAGPMEVLPVQLRWSDYAVPPDSNWLRRWGDGTFNVLSVGRIAPNKRLEDVISAYAVFRQRHPRSRLILAGSFSPGDGYYLHLLRHIAALGAENVVFTGHIELPQLLALYRTAGVYLCMSEHEGFCVPLLEAMAFGVPVAAYESSAVGETVGSGGVLFARKDFRSVAEDMERLIAERELWRQRAFARIRDFHYEQSEQRLLRLLHLGERESAPLFPFDSGGSIGYNGENIL